MIPDVTEYLASLKKSPKFGPQVVCHRSFSVSDALYAEDFPPFADDLKTILVESGILRLYSHQHKAICSILAGKNVLVATPTASGKSMVYNLPVLNDLLSEEPGHSLYLFPLKALAQDQHNVLQALYDKLQADRDPMGRPLSAIFDGDTSGYKRRKIRDLPPRVVLTNPEMVHLSLLPYHHSWSQFFSRLRYVVIDEVHSYR